jgi:hypothetical protein
MKQKKFYIEIVLISNNYKQKPNSFNIVGVVSIF